MNNAGPTTIRSGDVALGWRALDVLISVKARILPRTLPRRLVTGAQLLPAILLIAVLVVGVALMVWRSVHSFDAFTYREGGLSVSHYTQLVQSDFTVSLFERTMLMALVTTPVALALALPFAFVTVRAKSTFVRMALITAIFFPFLTGDVVRGYGWLAILGPHGPIAWASNGLGFGEIRILGTRWGVAIGVVQALLPIAVMILIPAFARLDREVERAAGTMGARPVKVFWLVIVPQVRTALIGAAVVAATLSLTDFADPTLLGQGRSDYVANQIQSVVLGLNDPYKGSALAVMLLLVVLIVVGTMLLLMKLGEVGMAWERRRQRRMSP